MASDHHLVVPRLKLKLKKNWMATHMEQNKYNTAFLRDTNKQLEFRITHNNKFRAIEDLLEEEEGNRESKWKWIMEAVNMPGSAWPQEAPTQRVDLCRHSGQDSGEEEQEDGRR